MKRVLVTGASGFIGREAPRLLLERGYDVHAVSSSRDDGEAAGIVWHQADLLAREQVETLMQRVKPTHLLHFAWYAEPGAFWASPENLRWLDASVHLFGTFAEADGRRAVSAGSCAEYEWSDRVFSEATTPLAPATLYGAAKHALERALAAFGRTELSTAWGRIFFAYGPHEDPRRLVSSVARALLSGDPALCSEGHQRRDFLYAPDVASAFVHLLDGVVEGPVNIASGTAVSVRDVVCQIAKTIGRPDLLRFGELPTSPNDPPALLADVRRLTEEVGWRPSTSLTDGIASTVEWWRREL